MVCGCQADDYLNEQAGVTSTQRNLFGVKERILTAKRRVGAVQAATRTAILDAAQDLTMSDGYAAVTARQVAAKADVKPALVEYYFPSMDDLFLTLYRRAVDRSVDQQTAALSSIQPLRALWTLSSDARHAALMVEFMALANHRKSICAEIGK